MANVHRLPLPVAETWDWQMHASCRDMHSDVFFHPERERGTARAEREARAKRVCRGCPVMEQCRGHALAVHEPYGVWGGLSETERKEQLHAAHTVIGVGFARGQRGRSRGTTPGPWPAA